MTIYALLFGLLVGAAIVCLGLFFRQAGGGKVRQRLQVQKKPDQSRLRLEEGWNLLPAEIVRKWEEKLGVKRGSPRREEMKKTLAQAGYDSERAVSLVLGLKLGLLVALPLLALVWLEGRHLLAVLIVMYLAGSLGYFLPDLVVKRLVATRQKKIKEGLPDALDLLVVCVEAGQGLNAALKKVAEDLALSNQTLSRELLTVNLEINAGMEREQALRNLGDRTGVDEVASLCSILIQSDRFGTSIGQALKVQSETLRTSRRQKMEELAAKTPVKLVFPLIFFIFPAIMVVILGPAVIKISTSFVR